MPKRSCEEKIQHYKMKLQKLQKKQNATPPPADSLSHENSYNEPPAENPSPQPEEQMVTMETAPVPTNTDTQVDGSEEIDIEFLSALGDITPETPMYGEKIHETMAERWLPILRGGLPKEAAELLLNQYKIPENCKLLRAPPLSPEMISAISSTARSIDKKIENLQQQLGLGITAINRAMNILITGSGDKEDKVQTLRFLSDACRILCDLHYKDSESRSNLIPKSKKSLLSVIPDVERDDSLLIFKLGEKIRASEIVKKQAQKNEVAAIQKPPAPSTSQSSPSEDSRNAETTVSTTGNNTSEGQLQQAASSSAPVNLPSPSNRQGEGRRTEDSHDDEAIVPITRDDTSDAEAIVPITRDDTSDAEATVSTTGNNTSEGQLQQAASSSAPVNLPSVSTSEGAYPGYDEVLRHALRLRGTPEDALGLTLASWTENTLKRYNVSFKRWWTFCQDNNLNFYESSISCLIFLKKEFDEGKSYGTLKKHRSALAVLLGQEISNDIKIKQLLKGAFKKRPSYAKYSSTWDPQVVLNHISNWCSNKELSLEQLTKKLVMLLALCTAHRVQTLSLIKLHNIKTDSNGIKIIISDPIKTSGPGRKQPELVLPYFNENKSICPAAVIEHYIKCTKDIRPTDVNNLILRFKQPYRAAAPRHISKWIKEVLADSGVDTTVFGAHSTRHASTSAARSAGISLDVILRAAGWTNTSTFARYYDRPISDEGAFAKSILSKK
ncbi:uncharacterized protein LOC105390343 isoform X2 [Plutella xylostella]|uniref:uncharacterized protein LOC105390343 isoform X2 n=1 Tax=Plutella xylostella TaxID=51655 RepID=UPI0020325850|nr:uncharacterized protein LOC105390343 isoform X2 [Plutella xylostella]